MNLKTNFIEQFLKINPVGNIKSNFSIAQIGTSASGLSGLLPVINEIKAKLANRVQMGSELVPAFLHSYDFIPDLSEADPVLENNDRDTFIAEIDEESAQTLIDSFDSTIDFGASAEELSQSSNPGITITDQTGHVFEFVRRSATINGSTSIICTTNNPASEEDFLLYQKDGKYYFNTLLRSKGYWRYDLPLPDNNVNDDLFMSILDWLDINDISNDHYAMSVAMANYYHLTVSSTIQQNLYNVADHLGLLPAGDNSINELLIAIEQYAIDQESANNYGVVKYYGDVVSDLAHSDTINNVLLAAADLVSNARFNIESFGQMIAEYTKDASVSVQKVISGIGAAYATGGVYGVAKYIINFITRGTSVRYSDENGVLQFTDNSTFVPNEYIAGMVCTIVGSVVSVIGLIVSIFSRVVGVALTILGTAVMQIPKLINYDYNTATWAGLNSNNDTSSNEMVLPYFPHGMYQTEMRKSDLHSSLQKVINDGTSFFMLEIPGGCIIVGPGADASYIRAEYHPAVCEVDLRRVFSSNITYITTRNTDQDITTGAFICPDPYVFSPQNIHNDVDTLMSIWADAKLLNVNIDENNLIANEYDDAKVRLAFMQSLVLSMLYFQAVSYDGEWGSQYYYRNQKIIYSYTSILGGSADEPWIPMYNITNYRCRAIGTLYENRNINILGYCGFINMQNLPYIYNKTLFEEGELRSTLNQRLYDNIWTNGLQGGIIPSWAELVQIANASNESRRLLGVGIGRDSFPTLYSEWSYSAYRLSSSSLIGVVEYSRYINNLQDVPEKFVWAISTPKYNRSTFMMWVILSAVIALAVTVITVIAAVKVRKAIQRKQAINGAKVEKAWNDFTSDPTTENYKAYKKTVFKTNTFATITGGTKYSRNNYWDGDPSANSDDSSSGVIASVKNSLNNENEVSDNVMKLAAISTVVDDVAEDITDVEQVGDDSNTRIRATEQNIEEALLKISEIRRILKR